MPEPTRNGKSALKWLAVLALLACLLPGCGYSPPAGGDQPQWLTQLIRKLESEPVANPPAAIYRYEYDGQVVYYLPPRCCDIASQLFDEEGNVICCPDGGITGKGDGRCPEFKDKRQNEVVIWQDKRTR